MTSVHVALAQAHKSTDTTQRLHNLKIVEAILLEQKQEVTLNNIESVLLFYTDSENSLQLFVLSFIEKLCSLYVEVACIPALQTLLKFYNTHPSPVLQKRAILTLCSIYKPIFQWISASAKVAAVHRKAWELLCVLRDRIVHLIPSSVPEAVRLSIYKYIQRVILVQTPVSFEVRDRGASQTEDNLNFNVSTLPYDHSLLSRADLVTEANSYVSLLINYLRNPVSATSLIVLTNLLSEIARKRPDYYLPRVLQSLIRLCQAFPAFQPYQLVSLKKQIKVHFMALRSVPLAKDFYSQISAIIESFGGNKAGKPLYLEPGAREKRLREESSERLRPKRTKPATTSGSSAQLLMRLDGLPHHVIVDLLLAHLARLPTSMPASFPQIMTVAQLYTISSATHKTERAFSNGVQTSNLKTHIDLNLKCVQNVEDSSGPAGPARVLEPATGADPKSKHTPFKVKPVPLKNCDKLAAFSRLLDSENDLFLQSGARKIRRALLAKLAQVQQVFEKYKDPAHSDFNDFTVLLRDVLTKDIRKHQTLAVAWLYEEYTSAMHKRRFGDKEIPTALCAGSGFAIEEAPTNSFKVDINTTDLEGAAGQMSRGAPPQYLERYLACYDFIVKIVKGIVNNEHRETLFRRFLLEVPEVSIEAFKAIEEFCNDEYRAKFGFESLYELVLYRPRYRAYSLNTLLAFTIIEKKLIRSLSGQVCVRLCAIDGDIKAKICNFAMKCLRYLEREPPDDVQEERSADDSVEQPSAGDAISTDPSTQESADRPSKRWPLESVQAYSSLFFALCMETPEFLKSLLPVYAQVKSEVQRGFLQAVTPVVLNFHSDAIFQKLFQNAPENSYQLLLFMLEIYTKHAPERGACGLYPRVIRQTEVPRGYINTSYNEITKERYTFRATEACFASRKSNAEVDVLFAGKAVRGSGAAHFAYRLPFSRARHFCDPAD
ncbi:symplekin-like isoform X3 [Zophobas morio]|uniref:symplekin-like isoform X3 n=1 Tax=Zophobas morio TaxID=2755281 RepID=UPI003082D93A